MSGPRLTAPSRNEVMLKNQTVSGWKPRGGIYGYGDGLRWGSARIGIDALDEPHILHHLHGDDRQPAIRLDAIRQSDQQGARLVHRLDPGRLRHIHRARNMAHAGRGLDRRHARCATRTQAHGCLRRHHGRHRLGHQRLCRFFVVALSRRHHLRHRRWRDLCDLRRHGGEMVPRPPRSRRRSHRGRLRRGLRD